MRKDCSKISPAELGNMVYRIINSGKDAEVTRDREGNPKVLEVHKKKVG